jgi:membrane-anchored mycosin MYCP
VEHGRAAACTVLAAAAAVLPAAPAAAAPPPGVCLTPPRAAEPIRDRPWEDRQLDPARVWPVSTGAGVLVGVIDSGVDSDHPQLAGRVLEGFDYVRNVPGARFDCAPHGTAVASIIAAAPVAGTAFHGVAPGVRILPVRVTDRDQIDEGDGSGTRAETIGTAIRYAVDAGARVINMSLTVFRDIPEIRNAVQYARFKDVLVVAAAGNLRSEGNPTPYPAAYEGVLGVGSVDIAGARAEGSQVGPYVDLVAPGVKVTGADPGRGHELWEGTSFATPFVSGAAALIRAARPELTADQVADRLTATAGVARGGARGPEYGAGVVDPYRAVTDTVATAPAAAAPLPAVAGRPDPGAEREAAARRSYEDSRRIVLAILGATALALAVAGLLGGSRRRGWTPARSPAPGDEDTD